MAQEWGRGEGRGGQLGWAVWAVWVLGWLFVLGVWGVEVSGLLCCENVERHRQAKGLYHEKGSGERWALILVLPRHFGRVVKASAC